MDLYFASPTLERFSSLGYQFPTTSFITLVDSGRKNCTLLVSCTVITATINQFLRSFTVLERTNHKERNCKQGNDDCSSTQQQQFNPAFILNLYFFLFRFGLSFLAHGLPVPPQRGHFLSHQKILRIHGKCLRGTFPLPLQKGQRNERTYSPA